MGHASLVRPWAQGGAVQELPKSSRCGHHSRARGSEKKIDKKTSNHMEKKEKHSMLMERVLINIQ